MNVFRNFTILVVAILISCSAYSQTHDDHRDGECAATSIKLVSQHLKIRELKFGSQDDGDDPEKVGGVIASACKKSPTDQSLMIVSFAYDVGVEYEKKLVVAIIDTNKNKVEAVYQGVIGEDAVLTIGPGSLTLDTARYNLASGVRAFGLDFSTVYSQGCVDGGLGPTRTLFVREGKTIRPVLEGLYLSTWTFIKGGPSCANGDREIVVETTSYTISVLNSATNGFKDLRVLGIPTRDNSKKSRKKPVTYVVKYDGKIYPIGHIGW